MKALVGTFNQEKALVRAFSVIVKTNSETDGSYTALLLTDHTEQQPSPHTPHCSPVSSQPAAAVASWTLVSTGHPAKAATVLRPASIQPLYSLTQPQIDTLKGWWWPGLAGQAVCACLHTGHFPPR